MYFRLVLIGVLCLAGLSPFLPRIEKVSARATVPLSPYTAKVDLSPVSGTCLRVVKTLIYSITTSHVANLSHHTQGGYVGDLPAGPIFLGWRSRGCSGDMQLLEYDWEKHRFPVAVRLKNSSIAYVSLYINGNAAFLNAENRNGVSITKRLSTLPASLWVEFQRHGTLMFLRYRRNANDRKHTALLHGVFKVEFVDTIEDGKHGPLLRTTSIPI